MKLRPPFQVTKNGESIEDYPVAGTINPGIGYSLRFLEWQAGVAAGCDMWDWESGIYPASFKARVVAWYELTRLVEMHVEDERGKAAKRQAKRKS